MNEIYIMSHNQLETYSRDEFVNDFVAIVVYSHGKKMPYIEDNPQMKDLLIEQFDDVDDIKDGMTVEQAKQIASFVRKHAQDSTNIIVSCQYGQSRSAGIAAAISAFFEQDEMGIFSNPNKMPNMHCYALVCQALNVERNEDDLRKRFLVNANAAR